MSRGPGRWQRLLLHELYHAGCSEIYVGNYATTRTEASAAYRAARAIKAKGWAATRPYYPWCNYLTRSERLPTAAERSRCPLCKCSQLVQSHPPGNT